FGDSAGSNKPFDSHRRRQFGIDSLTLVASVLEAHIESYPSKSGLDITHQSIDDVRFVMDAEPIHQHGGRLVHANDVDRAHTRRSLSTTLSRAATAAISPMYSLNSSLVLP
ncbi:hypothetical protein KMS84_38605, partial [Streptomyces sp. IBSBF 2807]|nr:hypothetical protein [Streptomyces hilarionis]